MTSKKTKPTIPNTFKAPIVPERKRRASFSNDNEADPSEDPESLLVPMVSKAAKISRRRSTIQVAKCRKPTLAIQPQSTNNLNQNAMETSVKMNGSIPEIKQNLKHDIDERKYKQSMQN